MTIDQLRPAGGSVRRTRVSEASSGRIGPSIRSSQPRDSLTGHTVQLAGTFSVSNERCSTATGDGSATLVLRGGP